MGGPVLAIELAEAVPVAVIERLRELLAGLSTRLEEKRVGEYDLQIQAESLGIADADEIDGHRPFLVSLMGPGIGDEWIFEAEHPEEVDQEALIGFTPTHAVNVIALANEPIDHVATALLTVAIMDVIGGVANAELAQGQRAIVDGLPGLIATTRTSWPTLPAAYGSAEFIKAWSRQTGFRLLT
ncbi:DUF6368 family protein [Kitasatospora sp. NPDC091276]|uniref:DUF6368 family protein n=1 Tax=Kitasatospora sp. NPDC091276 TaxID=3155300 RepID=UPI00343AA070